MYNIWLVFASLGMTLAAEDYANNPSVQLFQEYLRINTTSYGDLAPAVEFWSRCASAEGVPISVHEFAEGFPVLVMKWSGANSSLGSIMLNSHMDVVPADENDGWTYPPFAAYLDDDGVIWGRGSQDMKSVSLQYFEALKRLKDKGVAFLRDVYMTLMPDEELGAEAGMIPFLASSEFAAMGVGLALDEAGSANIPVIPVLYQDKVAWQIRVDCYGEAGHGSTLPKTNDTATGKCHNVMTSLLNFRDQEYEKSLVAGVTNAGSYTSVNLNKMNAGTANNVIPNHVSLVFDIRLCITLDEDDFETQLNQWIADAGENITLTFIEQDKQSPATLIGSSNPYWVTTTTVLNSLGVLFVPIVAPGSTDARYVRAAGIPAFGLSPMPNTKNLLHAVDERLAADTFLAGIDIYENLIRNLANIPGDLTSEDPSVYVYKTTV